MNTPPQPALLHHQVQGGGDWIQIFGGNHKHLNGLRQHYFARHVIRWEDNGANC